MITTKAHEGIILRDLDIFKDFQADLTVLVGLSNLNQLKGVEHSEQIENIQLANHLNQSGVKVWVFITPILPMITDVEKMINRINPDIPVFLDKLRLEKGTVAANMTMAYINTNYPKLKHTYEEIILNDRCDYIDYLRSIYKESERVKFVFE